MKVQIMTDSQYGNGKKLAETIKSVFSKDEVNIDDVKDISPQKVAENVPDVFILGGAIRAFHGDTKSKKFLKQLNELLEKSGKKIKYGTGFLTHSLPTKRVQGFSKRYLKHIQNASMIDKTYNPLLTAQVETMQGPIKPEEMEKAKKYIQDFIAWMK